MKSGKKKCRICKGIVDVFFDTDICSQCAYTNHYKDYDAKAEMNKTITGLIALDYEQNKIIK